MAGLKIQRAERQVEDPSKVKTGEFRAPTAGTEAQQQLGGAITQTAVALGQVADRVITAGERMEKAKLLNRSTAAANAVRQDLVEFKAQELNAVAGLDTEGNVKRLEDSYSESILNRTADLSDEEKALVQQGLQADILRDRTAFAVHQQKQLVGVTANNLDQALNTAVQAVSVNPTMGTIEEQIKAHALTVITYDAEGVIDKEESENRRIEGIEKIIEAGVTSATLQDAEMGQILLDQMKSALPPEKVKTLEADISKQAKIQTDAIEAARTESVENFTNETIDLALKGEATETQMEADPRWKKANPSERKTLRSIVKDSNPFNESDPVTLASFTSRVNTAPLELTEQEFLSAHGKGLNTPDFNRLFQQWKTSVEEIKKGAAEDPLQKGFEAQAYGLVEKMREDKVFLEERGFFEPGGQLAGDSPEELIENDLRAAQQVNSLAQYIVDHPGENYVETYIIPVLKPIQEKFVAGIYDRVTGFFDEEPFIKVEQDLDVRRQASDLLRESDVALTRENINSASAQIQAGNAELKILDAETMQEIFATAPGKTREEKGEATRRIAIKRGFIIP